jgi:hypothetical protein
MSSSPTCPCRSSRHSKLSEKGLSILNEATEKVISSLNEAKKGIDVNDFKIGTADSPPADPNTKDSGSFLVSLKPSCENWV